MKLRPLALSLLAGMTFGLNSCIQSDSDTTLNPDGSGKFTIKATMDLGPLMGLMQGAAGGEGAPDMGDPGKEMLVGILGSTQGVDVWKEAKSVKGADGKITISASGYFKDISKFKAGNPMESMGGAGGGGKSSGGSMGEIKSSKDADGNWVIEIPMGGKEKAAGAEPAEPAEKLSKEEVASKVKEMRDQFAAMKPMMATMMSGLKIAQEVKVGGKIKDYGLFTKVDDSTAKLEMSFTKMFDGIEKMMADDKIAAQMAAAGGNPMELIGSDDPAAKELAKSLTESMFGGKGEPKLIVTPGDAAFDYEKEAAAAKAGQTPELKKLLKDAAEKAGESEEAPAKKAA